VWEFLGFFHGAGGVWKRHLREPPLARVHRAMLQELQSRILKRKMSVAGNSMRKTVKGKG
jgi:hypothetical protein